MSCAYLVELSSIANAEARIYPMIVSMMVLGVSALTLLSEVRTEVSNVRNAQGSGELDNNGGAELRAAGYLALSLCVLILGLTYIGTILSALIFIVVYRVLLRCFVAKEFAIEALVVLLIAWGFRNVLHIPLPLGWADHLFFSIF
nr:tripartite tricarboxylate transporter TctB family protein [Epibacterium sp. Ofav1-8]